MILIGGGPSAWAAASPSPTTPAAPAAAPDNPNGAVFGIGPSNGQRADGRSFFNFLASPGGQLTDHAFVTNLSSQPQNLRVYAVDAVSGTDGSIGYAPASAAPKDAGSWLNIGNLGDLGSVTVPAGRSLNLPFTLHVPTTASPGDHIGALIVSLTSKVKNDKGENVNFEQRVASRVDIRVSGAITAKLTIDNMSASYSPGFVINPFGSGDATVTYRVHNAGNVILGGKQAVTISGWYGGTKKAVVADIPAMLPGAYTVVSTKIRNVPAAFRLTAKASVTPVPPVNAVDPVLAHAVSSASIWAVPWTIPIVVILLIGGIGFYFWRRTHRPTPTPNRHSTSHSRSRSPRRVPVSHSQRAKV